MTSRASAATSIAAVNTATPPANMRRRPTRSASAPVLAMNAAKVRKKAFTTHCTAVGPACRFAPMSVSASAAPVAVTGTSSRAPQTTGSTARRRTEGEGFTGALQL
ncbi:hypothetical protein GCM10009678_90980 [Actinomadura kijaniata]